MAHALLAATTDLEIHGLGIDFIDGFVPRIIELSISVGGALGTMAFQWRRKGETSYQAAVTSAAGATWAYRASKAYADLTFGAGTYVVSTTYSVGTDGVVTPGAGALAAVTATRFDLRTEQLQAATEDAIGWMWPRVIPPITAWGTDIRSRVARLAGVRLKKIVGMAPGDAGAGEAVLLGDEDRISEWFRSVGRGDTNPQGLADSSASKVGRGMIALPVGDALREW